MSLQTGMSYWFMVKVCLVSTSTASCCTYYVCYATLSLQPFLKSKQRRRLTLTTLRRACTVYACYAFSRVVSSAARFDSYRVYHVYRGGLQPLHCAHTQAAFSRLTFAFAFSLYYNVLPFLGKPLLLFLCCHVEKCLLLRPRYTPCFDCSREKK